MHVSTNEIEKSCDAFYSPISKYEYLTPLQRKKLREKRNTDYTSTDLEIPKSKSRVHKVTKNNRRTKPKLKKQNKNLLLKKLKANLPEVCCTAAQLMSKDKNNACETNKFFKSRSPGHFNKAKFVVPLIYKKTRLDFGNVVSSASPISPNIKNNSQNSVSEDSSNQNVRISCSENHITFHPIVVNVAPVVESKVKFQENSLNSHCSPKKIVQEESLVSENQENFPDNVGGCELQFSESIANLQTDSNIAKQGIDKVISPVSNISSGDEVSSSSNPKFYPLFYMNKSKDEAKTEDKFNHIVCQKSFITKDTSRGSEQMIIDAGQKEIGAKQCKTCSMIYTIGQEEDENLHSKYHNMYLVNLKFPGWKKEHVIGNYDDGRIIKVLEDDNNFKLKKVQDILLIANRDLGFPSAEFPVRPNLNFLLFISNDKRVRGCLVAESITSASPVILDESFSSKNELEEENTIWKMGSWYASSESVRAICGINRIWVSKEYRRRRVASRLVDCLRSNFIFGHVVSLQELAFTDPSPDGRDFAATYTGTDNFLVYK